MPYPALGMRRKVVYELEAIELLVWDISVRRFDVQSDMVPFSLPSPDVVVAASTKIQLPNLSAQGFHDTNSRKATLRLSPKLRMNKSGRLE